MSKVKAELKLLPIDLLVRGEYQPRQIFDPIALNELADSIKANGIIQPIVVRPLDAQRFEIIAGERRWRAAQLAGLEYVPCLINDYSNEQAAAVTTIENVNRVNLNPIEEAKAYAKLVDEFGYMHEEVAAVVGKSRVAITNALRLLKLSTAVQVFIIDNKLTEGHGKILAGLLEAEQLTFANKCIEKGWSVRQLEQAIKNPQSSATSSDSDPNLKALTRALSDHVGCRVSIGSIQGKGELKIHFDNLDVLEGLFQKMGFAYSDLD